MANKRTIDYICKYEKNNTWYRSYLEAGTHGLINPLFLMISHAPVVLLAIGLHGTQDCTFVPV